MSDPLPDPDDDDPIADVDDPALPSTLLDRRLVTDAVLTQLRTSDKAVGDGVLPDANWIGQPNLPTSTFEPFCVLSSLNAAGPSGTIGDSRAIWKLPYLVESFGVSREQCEWMADHVRDLLDGLRRSSVDMGGELGKFKVIYVEPSGVGTPARIDVTDPEFWHAQDTFTVWMGRSSAT